MSESLMGAVLFYALAALTVGGAVMVAFSRNIVHSAFSLLATLIGAAGLYAYLSAELMVVLQVMVYVGGVLVVMLFAVMLTARISEAQVSNPSVGRLPGAALLVLLAGSIGFVAFGVFGDAMKNQSAASVSDIGNALLGTYLLPFQVASIVLLAVLVGAVSIARGVKQEDLQREPRPDELEPQVTTDDRAAQARGEAA